MAFRECAPVEELGFTHVMVYKHHFRGDGSAALSPLILLSAMAARTEKICISTFVFLLALQPPIHAAEDIAPLEIISNGRLDLGLGPRYDQPE
jgi:alkanesulfonate monooxygenase SsuD/methylene tetrahydromethanopterin reductase-like flavin-dependent oxidoreductase (luciferase family)